MPFKRTNGHVTTTRGQRAAATTKKTLLLLLLTLFSQGTRLEPRDDTPIDRSLQAAVALSLLSRHVVPANACLYFVGTGLGYIQTRTKG